MECNNGVALHNLQVFILGIEWGRSVSDCKQNKGMKIILINYCIKIIQFVMIIMTRNRELLNSKKGEIYE